MWLWRAIVAYAAHDDPLAAASNRIALLVASNQPFYPLYVSYLVGSGAAVSTFTFLSTPLFLAVPALARRHSVAGRALLPAVGIANTILCARLFGEASGVELFLLPCLMIATLQFRAHERGAMLTIVAAIVLCYAGLHGRYGTPLHAFSTDDYARFFNLNAYSVGGLVVMVGLTFSSALAAASRPPAHDGVAPSGRGPHDQAG